MCYQEPCVKCFHCRKCVVICANELDSVTFNAAIPPNTTVTIDPSTRNAWAEKAQMSDDEAFEIMDSIRKDKPWQ
jgi:hypothetical protein